MAEIDDDAKKRSSLDFANGSRIAICARKEGCVCFNEKVGHVDPFAQYEELPRMTYLEFDQRNTDLNDLEKEQLNNDDERQALLNHSMASQRNAGGLLAQNL